MFARNNRFPQKIRHSRASNSELDGLIRPKIEFIRDLMAILVTSKFDQDPGKTEIASLETIFSHYKSTGNFDTLKGT